ncbi:hypothetical protein KUTeg_015324 [Tegillarca granosa]|uniref:Calcineurin-like phosphoesterase domain-containing protein n=1 Tax=Tegillarca granosa TaxID=220873 RepID=A0ABQ9EUB4_TEGGR|nr:hypothetical protein KUTeg_015324 [Tegillarca granosa]
MMSKLWKWLRKKSESSVKIKPDPLTRNPDIVWDSMRPEQNYQKITPLDPETPISDECVRFVCISDTHTFIENKPSYFLPDGDVLLHAGDITNEGQIKKLVEFNDYLGKLSYKHKVVIAGNHDITLDTDMIQKDPESAMLNFGIICELLKQYSVKQTKDLFTNCTYLQDSGVQLYGINIYGSPWQPVFRDWAFNLRRGEEILKKWDKIPNNTDILITHGPPLGYGDEVGHHGSGHVGCVELLNTVQKRVHPKYHVFGHIHEGYGVTSDGETTFINASFVNRLFLPVNSPIVFDYPLPNGYKKDK